MKALESVEYPGGSRATADGINHVVDYIFNTASDRPDAPNVLIIITNGNPDVPASEERAEEEAKTAAIRANRYASIFVVGVSGNIKADLLKNLSSPPHVFKENYFTAITFDELPSTAYRVVLQSARREIMKTTTTTTAATSLVTSEAEETEQTSSTITLASSSVSMIYDVTTITESSQPGGTKGTDHTDVHLYPQCLNNSMKDYQLFCSIVSSADQRIIVAVCILAVVTIMVLMIIFIAQR